MKKYYIFLLVMLKIVLFAFIFCIVLFIYLHIQFHLKTSNDLEVYELEQESKDKLDEICDFRQPVIFDFHNEKIMTSLSKTNILEKYQAHDVKIRDISDTNQNNETYVPLALNLATKLFDEDTKKTYFTEKNNDFLLETGLIKIMQYNDEFIRPPMMSNSYFDILMGPVDCETPFRFNVNYRNFFLVTQGTLKIKLAPPHNSKYLSPIYDYENFEFRSQINPWKGQPEYANEFEKLKSIAVVLIPGKMINIPPYWWYSFKFEKDTTIASFQYRTYMNNVAVLPHIALYALQNQNIKRETFKKHNIPIPTSVPSSETSIPDNTETTPSEKIKDN
jgi:Cupin-like domain